MTEINESRNGLIVSVSRGLQNTGGALSYRAR